MATRREGGAGVSRRVLGLLAAWFAACLPAGAALPVPLPVPESEPPVAEAASADGRYRLRIEGWDWVPCMKEGEAPRLGIALKLEGCGPDELLAFQDPLHRLVTGDGSEAPRVPAWTEVDRVNLSSGRREFTTMIDLPRGTGWIADLDYEVPILRVRSWEAIAFEVPAGGTVGPIAAPPFTVSAEAGPQICGITIRSEGTRLVDGDWGYETVEVRDARGTRLERFAWWGWGSSGYALPVPERGVPGLIAYPVTVRFRVPRGHSLERVRFEFRDLPLLPQETGCRQGSVVSSPTTTDPLGAAWTPWSAPAEGLSLRALLPTAARRGDDLPVRVRLRFDPRGLPQGVTDFDGRAFEDRLRLHFRNPLTGARVDLEDDDQERVLETIEPSSAGSAHADPLVVPIRGGEQREWRVDFEMARAWESLAPGEWRVHASLEVQGESSSAFAWRGRVVTDPAPLRIEEAPPRREVVPVPTALRLRPGPRPGSAEVCYGPGEAKVIEVEARCGFRLGTASGDEEVGTSMSSWGAGISHFDTVVDTIDRLQEGDLERAYHFEVFEFAGEMGPLFPLSPEPGRNSYRTLWKGTLRVSATAEEVRQLSGSVPPLPAPEPVLVAATGPDAGEIVLHLVDADTGAAVPGGQVSWLEESSDPDDPFSCRVLPLPRTPVVGEFRFRGPAGLQRFEVEAPGYASPGEFDGVPVEVRAGVLTEREIPLQKGGSLRIGFRCEGEPASPRGTTLRSGRTPGGPWRFGRDGTVRDGAARWDNLTAGTHLLEVDAGPGYEHVPDREVDVLAGETTDLVIDLERRTPLKDATSGVRGTVTFHPGWGRIRTKVRFEGAEPANADLEVETDPLAVEPGKAVGFALGRLPAGRYLAVVSPQWHKVVEVSEEGGRFDFVIPEPSEVRVRVVADESGEPLRGARLNWVHNEPERECYTFDSIEPNPRTGEFLFKAPPGEIDFGVRAPGRTEVVGEAEGSLVLQPGGKVERTVRLALAGSVRCFLRCDGRPVPDEGIVVSLRPGSRAPGSTADGVVSYTLNRRTAFLDWVDLPTGLYVVEFQDLQARFEDPPDREIEVRADGPTEFTIELVPRR